MKVSNFKKPFYLGAVALFATTTLALAQPVISHADSNSDVDSQLYSALPKDQYGLRYSDYEMYNRPAFVKSTLPAQKKYTTIGIIDGINNVTIDKTMKSNYYLQGYMTGQIIAQGWLTYVKYGNDISKLPQTTRPQLRNWLELGYHAYQNGIHLTLDGNNYQDWIPSSNDENSLYDYIKEKAMGDANIVRTGATMQNLTPSLSKYLTNKTPFGVSETDTKSIDSIKKQFGFNDVFASSDSTNIPINVLHMSTDESTLLNNRNVDIYAHGEDYSNVSDDTSSTPVAVKPSTNHHEQKVTKKVVKKHKTVKKHVAKKKVVKKHVKKATKKHSKKRVVVKKHVSKKHIQKIRTHIPHTVYAKHRTGVHSVPQFNHGKTYYVTKGHKFHVYYKISDGHGNWRYNVGKHKFITTIPGSIGTKRVKKHVTHHKHHVVKHVLHKHHRR